MAKETFHFKKEIKRKIIRDEKPRIIKKDVVRTRKNRRKRKKQIINHIYRNEA